MKSFTFFPPTTNVREYVDERISVRAFPADLMCGIRLCMFFSLRNHSVSQNANKPFVSETNTIPDLLLDKQSHAFLSNASCRTL